MRRLRKRVHGLLRCLLVVLGWLTIADLPAKEKWFTGSVEEFTVYANTSKGVASRVVENLLEVREIFSKVSSDLMPKYRVPLRVFVFKDEATVGRFLPLSRRNRKDFGGMYTRDLEGDLMLIRGEFADETVRRLVYHEYIHFLMQHSGIRLPIWLNEGLAELYSSIELVGREARIGKPIEGRAIQLQRKKPIPFERLFRITPESPEYKSWRHGKGTFYAQSWALVHLLAYGKTDLPKEAFGELLNRVVSEPIVSEQTLREVTGLGFKEMEKRLNRYVNGMNYGFLRMKRPELPSEATLELSRASEGEVDLIEGMLLLVLQGPEQAYAPLQHAYRNLPDSPEAAAYQGYYRFHQELYPAAVEAFEEAIERGSRSAATYVFHAATILRRDNPEGKRGTGIFDKKDTVKLLESLFKARELGERRPMLYHCIAKVWLSSEVTARPAHIKVVAEGLRLHPNDLRVGYYLAELLINIERYDEARIVIEKFLQMNLSEKARRSFEELEERIEVGE